MLLIEETARNPAEPEKPQSSGGLFWYDFKRAYGWVVRSWSEVNLDFALPRGLLVLRARDGKAAGRDSVNAAISMFTDFLVGTRIRTSNTSVNSLETNLITICRSRDKSRGISKF